VPDLLACVAEQPLVDHHCHGVLRRDADEAALESWLSEGAGFPGGSPFDSQAGFAFLRWCPPVLGLPPHAELRDYAARRAELGATEVSKRFLQAAGLSALCVDTGYTPEPITSPAELGQAAGATAYEIVRLERVAEELAAAGTGAAAFAGAYRSALAARTADSGRVVGVKSIAAYRTGLELGGERPSDAEVTAAAGRWLAGAGDHDPPRLAQETLHRFFVWCGVDLGLPVQFHVGYGDSDVDLHRGNPLLLTPLLRAIQPTGVPVMLLHNYPYHREAGYLARSSPTSTATRAWPPTTSAPAPPRCSPRPWSSPRSANSCTPPTRSAWRSSTTWARRCSARPCPPSSPPAWTKTFIPNEPCFASRG